MADTEHLGGLSRVRISLQDMLRVALPDEAERVEKLPDEDAVEYAAERLIGRLSARVETLENELAAADEKLKDEVCERRRSEDLKDEFVSTVSHELRTPLSIAKEGIHLLLDEIPGPVNAQQRKVLVTARGNLDRLARIINDLLDISMIEAGKMVIVREELDVGRLVSRVASSMSPLASRKGLSITTEIATDSLLVFADEKRITQALTNLVSNAVKFTQEGGVRISACKREGMIECVIEDTGPGIPADELTRLFGKFVQINRQHGAGRRGTGLGLAIAKNIIDLHGGSIHAESAPGAGLRLTFTIPLFTEDEVLKAHIDDAIAKAEEAHKEFSAFMIRLEIEGDGATPLRQALASQGLFGLIEGRPVVRSTDVAFKRGQAEVLVIAGIEHRYVSVMYRRWVEQLTAILDEQGAGDGCRILFGQARWPKDGLSGESLLEAACSSLHEYELRQ